MKPFLRPTDRARLAPVGWVSEPAGVWAGRQVEVVFDPRRHQIVMMRGAPSDKARSDLVSEGYRRMAIDSGQEMWMRDRHVPGRGDVTADRLHPSRDGVARRRDGRPRPVSVMARSSVGVPTGR